MTDMHNLNVKLVAHMLGVSTRSIYDWREGEGLPFKKSATGKYTYDGALVSDWALIRELKKRGIHKPIPVTTTLTEIRQYLEDGGYRYRLQEIEYDVNGVEIR